MEVHSSERWSCVKLNGEDLLGMKIKKEEKMQIEKLPTLKLKYTLVVPFMGIVDALTMGSFFMNPAADGKLLIKAFYVICGIAGILFALWGLLWKTTIDGKTIKVNPVIGKKKVVPFSDLKKAVVYKKKKTGSIVSYELIDKNNQSIVTIYPLMKDSSTLMERLKRLKYPVEEMLVCNCSEDLRTRYADRKKTYEGTE